ncbi:MAG TPA: hypothetical protein VGQ36_22530 [Thermoanaerobaculia bacterium]|jgi:hypothetical protein|nr:hypothetical protein [Thermoanaerobaculia bacterium]
MGTVVYHVEGEVNQGCALEPYVSAVLPLLSAYGVRVSPEQFARLVGPGPRSVDQPMHATLGDANDAHLVIGANYDPGCGYDTPSTYWRMDGTNLIHSASGGRLTFFIAIIDYIYPPSRIAVRIESEAGAVEAFRHVINPVLDQCGFRET